MTQQFETGSPVQLKSGGPAMSVMECLGGGYEGGAYRCQWFSGTTLKEGLFPGLSLVKFEALPKDSTDGLAERLKAARKRVAEHENKTN
jgi:uncharacterized protein YodC (DUF2158 family)